MNHPSLGWLSARWRRLALAALLLIGTVCDFADYDRYAEGQRQTHYPPVGSIVVVARYGPNLSRPAPDGA